MTDEVRTHYGDDTPLDARWYVVHTYSGYENKVKEDLEKTIENRNLQDLILEVKYPTEQVTELKEGSKKPKTVLRKVYPGYVMVKMLVDVVEKERPAEQGGGKSIDLVMNPRAWYVVRNTRGCTGFVGPEGEPQPLTDEEVRNNALERVSVKVNYEVGDLVNVVDGPLEGFSGTVDEIDVDNNSVKVTVSMFGRENQVEFELDQLEKVQED